MRVAHLMQQYAFRYDVGFHAHNNLGSGLANAMTGLQHGAKIIDGTLLGTGKGGGNVDLLALFFTLGQEASMAPLMWFLDKWGTSQEIQLALMRISGGLNIHPTQIEQVFDRCQSLHETYEYMLGLDTNTKQLNHAVVK